MILKKKEIKRKSHKNLKNRPQYQNLPIYIRLKTRLIKVEGKKCF